MLCLKELWPTRQNMPPEKTKILITRSQKRSLVCAKLFERFGYESIGYPCIHYEASNELNIFFDDYVPKYSDNWVFISPTAVEYFAKHSRSKETLGSAQNIFAIGKSTAKMLKAHFGLTVIYPGSSNSENFVKLPQLKEVKNKRVYISRAQSGRDKIYAFLLEMGAFVEYVETYRTVFVTQEEISNMIHIIKRRGISCIVITSFELFKYLVTQLELMNDLAIFQELAITVVNKRMFNWAIGKGFANIIELPAVDNQTIVRSVTNYYKGNVHV